MVEAVRARSEIPVEHTWDVESVFRSDAAWEAGYRHVEELLAQAAQYRGQLANGARRLADFLALRDDVYRGTGPIFIYASLLRSVDTADPRAQGLFDRAIGLYSRAMGELSFDEPEIAAIGLPTLQRWMDEDDRLRTYAHYFETIERRRAHVRSAEVEQFLGLVQDNFITAEQIHSVVTEADMTFAPARGSDGQEYEVTQGSYDALLVSRDREVRRTAWESYADAHLALKNGLAGCLGVGVKDHVFVARARNYPSALAAAMEPNHISVEVFYALIETFRRHLPTWHHYWRVRRRALGVQQLALYDIWAPLGTNPPRVTYQEAMRLIAEGMAPLGEEYVRIMTRGALDQRWVDIYPNQRKASGAFSTGWPGTHPFILMSFTDDIFSLSTLAHELGHSMHSYFAWATQPIVYADYGTFLAEVASNFNQALVRPHVLRSTDDPEMRIAVLEEALSNYHRYFFLMPTLARFELEIHERVQRGEPLTADGLMSLMADLFREGYGDEMAFDEARIGITWAEFSTHLYGNFYVWQYATGIAAANALARRVREGGVAEREAYLDFLRAGSSVYPLDALRRAGVDMTSSEPVEEAFAVLAELVDELETLVADRVTGGAQAPGSRS